MSDYLPPDLIPGILLRLPVPALLRCRSVSSRWRALIDSPRFKKLQLDYSAATAQNAILFLSEAHGDYVVAEYANGLRCGTGSAPPSQASSTDPYSPFALLGSCNGLLCFACDWDKVLISNPATRKGVFIPFTLLLKSHSTVGVYRHIDGRRRVIYNHGYGFGYDSVSDDYKVVQVVQLYKPELNSLNSHLVSYGVRSNSIVDIEFPYIILGSRQTGVFVGGAIHWTVGRNENPDGEGPEIVIVGFDLGLNELREVPQPDYSDGDEFTTALAELGKCLCIFVSYKDEFVDVWMMKEYGVKESWSILFSVPHPGLRYNDAIKPLGFSVTGQEVLLQLDNKKLVWYDMKDPKKVAAAEEIAIDGLKGENVDAVVCFGSLVWPYDKSPPLPKEEVKVVKPQQKPTRQQRRKKRDDFLSAGFNLKL